VTDGRDACDGWVRSRTIETESWLQKGSLLAEKTSGKWRIKGREKAGLKLRTPFQKVPNVRK